MKRAKDLRSIRANPGKEKASPGVGAASSRWGTLIFRCNICGRGCQTNMSELSREQPSCQECGSTVRMRAIVRLLSLELWGESLALPDFPVRPDIKGLGLSDWEGYAAHLAQKLDYTNTYYDREPRLDITGPDPKLEGTLDFLISSDVFEHVSPPVSLAFENACRLLKPGGVLIFSVPYTKEGTTQEHFPELYRYEIIRERGQPVLKNVTRDGREQFFHNLVFHGGSGFTLEMRVFSESSLLEELSKAGFSRVKIHGEPDFEHGIYWREDWSLPLTARR